MVVEKEPTFKIKIRACEFNRLNIVELTKKLKLMHDLNFTAFYTIVEDTNDPLPNLEWEKEKPKIEVKA